MPAQGLREVLLDLLAMPCVTGQEGPIADWLERRYAGERVRRSGHSVVVGGADDGRPVVLLVGHTDVVPPTAADVSPRIAGDTIVGRGASDMKSGLAVAMDCFEDHSLRAGPFDLVLVAYAGEEGSHDSNELGPVLQAMPDLLDAGLAVVLEPTDLDAHLGCMGTMHAEVTVRGRAAHSARPWQGESAVTKAVPLLARLAAHQVVDVAVDGLTFRDVVTVTTARTLNARNVVPDTFMINVNYRFAPDKTLEQARAHLLALIDDAGDVAIIDEAPAAPPRRGDPLVEQFLTTTGARVAPKQAWTDVARFAVHGVPALNYGPGLTSQAHQAGEYVPEANLVTARAALASFLAESA